MTTKIEAELKAISIALERNNELIKRYQQDIAYHSENYSQLNAVRSAKVIVCIGRHVRGLERDNNKLNIRMSELINVSDVSDSPYVYQETDKDK